MTILYRLLDYITNLHGYVNKLLHILHLVRVFRFTQYALP